MNVPMTLALNVRITNSKDGSVLERSFTKFPVRIGRSSLNDLQLDFGFVSQFHAVVERNEHTLFLRDLGSRNGSMISGAKVTAHQPQDLAPVGFTFDIGPLRFQTATLMVPRTGATDHRTAVLMAVDTGNPHGATEVWQAIAGPEVGRDPASAALGAIRSLAKLYTPKSGPLQDAESVLRFVSKMKQCIDLLFGAYIPLRDGCKQFQTSMDLHQPVGSAAEEGPPAAIRAARRPGEIAAVALDWKDPGAEALAAMQTTFADFVIHQLALIDGVMHGVRGLLRELSPKVVEDAFAKKGASMRFGPFKGDALWKMYAEKHADFSEEESQAFSLVFGPEFVRAYKQLKGEKERASVVPG